MATDAFIRAKNLQYGFDSYPVFRIVSERLKICLPPLLEQRTIAHTLGTLDDKSSHPRPSMFRVCQPPRCEGAGGL